MASKVKKLFHRKKDGEDEPEQQNPPQRRRRSSVGRDSPPFRHSLYENTTSAGDPQTGDYPMQSNGSQSYLPGRRSHGHRPADTDTPYPPPMPRPPNPSSATTYPSQSAYNQQQPPSANAYPSQPLSNRQGHSGAHAHSSQLMYNRQEQPTPNANPSTALLSHEFANLTLNNGDSSSPRSPARRSNPAPPSLVPAPYNEELPIRNAAGRSQANPQDLRNQVDPQDLRSQANVQDSQSLARRANLAAPTASSGLYSEDTANRSSPGISQADMRDPQYSYMSSVYGHGTDGDSGATGRNQGYIEKRDGNLGTVGNIEPYSRRHAPYSSVGKYESATGPQQPRSDVPRRRSIPRKEVGTSPMSASNAGNSTSPTQASMNHTQYSSIQKPLPTPPDEPLVFGGQHSGKGHSAQSSSVGQPPAPEEVAQRAKSSTYDTEVIERIAPAVVHETVNQEIHHVREEVITREIHNHEYYHRILPVIDVEVLPARHFLPVEGGGLVEVSADEVPGRGRSWVIAETASKIPSDEAAPRRRDRFSAREFVGTEGDTREYMTPEGFMRKEETWVHPPELETGARHTGQSWPMEFDSPKEKKPRHRSSSGDKHSKIRSPKKQSTIRTVGE